MANTITLAPASVHGQTIAFTESTPDGADFLYEPTINGKVYLTKSALRALKWDGQSNIRVSVASA